MPRRGRPAALALVVALALGALSCAREPPREPPRQTPLATFTTPFVFGRFSVPDDNPLTVESVALGRRLFHDERLSSTGAVSCATCHVQRLAFTDGRPTSIGVSGKPLAFNSMGLGNMLWGPQRFFWDGRAASLEEQALVPIQHADEMAQDIGKLVATLSADPATKAGFEAAYGEVSGAAIAKALASFQRTLVSSNSRYDRFLRGEVKLSDEEELGRKLFMAHPDVKVSLRGANCIDCHSQFLLAGFSARYDGFSNNGLDDEEHLQPGLMASTGDPRHRGMFKVPSLRNVALTAPYMHDGRFATLEQVLEHYDSGIRRSSTLSPLIVEADNLRAGEAGEQISLHLEPRERAAIIAFLNTLTDESFVTDERFSDPDAPKATRLDIAFHPFVGDEPLVLGAGRHANPGGKGHFTIRDAQLFVSNLRLTGGGEPRAETDSYHLVRFDGTEPAFTITLRDLPRRGYQRLELAIGVDPAANGTIAQRGDLDPNGRMAWTWEVGYKFVLVEGTLESGGTTVPLVYHVGFDESFTPIAIDLPPGLLDSASPRLDLRVDLLRLFDGIDMAALPTVKFDRADAARLAANLPRVIEPIR